MRKWLPVLLFAIPLFSQAQHAFRVELPTVKISAGTRIVLRVADTAYRSVTQGGKLVFQGKLDSVDPIQAGLVVLENDQPIGAAPVWLYPGTTRVTRFLLSDLTSLEATGSHPIFQHDKQLQQRVRPIEKRIQQLEEKANSGKVKEADLSKMEQEYLRLEKKLNQAIRNYVRDYPNRYRSAKLLEEAKVDWGRDSCQVLFNALSPELQQHPSLAQLRLFLEIGGEVRVGDQAPSLVGLSPKDDTLSLDQWRGKWVLLDFWASWCGPCRAENPELVKLYQRFQSRGLEIFAVSLDEKKADWIKAIEQDQLTWQHISDLKGFESVFAYRFGINAVPTKFLINPTGQVVARDIELDAMFVEYLEKHLPKE